MKPDLVRVLSLVMIVVAYTHNAAAFVEADEDWPGFRGPGAAGVAQGFATPTIWDATLESDQSIQWKSSVPGLGHSCPTIVGNRIFLTTAIASAEVSLDVGRNGNIAAADDNGEQTWLVLCYEKTSGRELWRAQAHQGIPRATRHTKATHANPTVAVEGDHVVAFFGSEGLYCYDFNGQLRWKKDLGVIDVSKYGIGWGYGSSPAIQNGMIVLVCDAPDNPFVTALRLSDGEEVWRNSRKSDCERSWGTPLIHSSVDATQVVINGWPWIVSYDLNTGKERWRIEGGGDNPIPTPFVANGHFLITNAHGGKSPIYSIRTSAQGNLTAATSPSDAGLAWKTDRGGSYMSTPVVYGDYLYLGDTSGVVRCYQAKTGEKVYENRLDGGAYVVASMLAADDKIYCTAEDGTVYVLQAGPNFRLLAKNKMGEPCHATPAISEGVLYVRTAKSLFAIVRDPARER